MPISLAWDAERRLWRLTAADSFTLGEVVEMIEQTDWKGARLYLWDFRTLSRGPASSDELRQAAELVGRRRALWPGSRSAIVVARDVDFGLARMFQVFAEGMGVDYQVFREVETALEWLEASPLPSPHGSSAPG